jgi:dTDP-glucose 4,6-dehydratase
VEDHCEAIDMVVRSGRSGETYCVGGNCEIANIDLTNMLLRHFSKDSSFIEYVKDRPGHDFRYAVDTSKIQQELGWKPRHDFDSGLRKTIDFYMKEQVWWRVLKEKQQFKEFHKKLYGKDA